MTIPGTRTPPKPPVSLADAWKMMMPSAAEDGDHTRAGRARAALRVPESLQIFRVFETLREEPPDNLVVSVRGDEIAISSSFFSITNPPARAVGWAGYQASFPDGWSSDGTDYRFFHWDRGPGPGSRFMPTFGGVPVTARLSEYVIFVGGREAVPRMSEDPPEATGVPARVYVDINWFGSGGGVLGYPVAHYEFEGANGGGAVGYDARVALFTHAGRFIVVSFARSNEGEVEADVTLPVEAKSLSITSAGYALLSGGNGGGNHLHVLDEKGKVNWAVPVGFDARQPAIDGGDGRLYVVGNGFAAFENGKTVWSSASPERVSAMAFSDGALAVAVGAELRVVARDGYVLTRFSAPGNEVLGRPAIGPDGAIWVASRTALYVAR